MDNEIRDAEYWNRQSAELKNELKKFVDDLEPDEESRERPPCTDSERTAAARGVKFYEVVKVPPVEEKTRPRPLTCQDLPKGFNIGIVRSITIEDGKSILMMSPNDYAAYLASIKPL